MLFGNEMLLLILTPSFSTPLNSTFWLNNIWTTLWYLTIQMKTIFGFKFFFVKYKISKGYLNQNIFGFSTRLRCTLVWTFKTLEINKKWSHSAIMLCYVVNPQTNLNQNSKFKSWGLAFCVWFFSVEECCPEFLTLHISVPMRRWVLNW